ncbi:MAG TPA: [protein-PII] uridylyltransferase, partial [Gammaproteobacteria bacterium]|nr:[protein-PII] uridylyltransferase [Gammaproteobacteria bacterium]
GANIGPAVRTPADTRKHIRDDPHAQTALLESRLLTGAGKLYAKVQETCGQQFWSKRQRVEFCVEKLAEFKRRRRAMGDTAFLMEPDVKNAKGGLRDVSTIFWLSMAWYGTPTARELIGQGLVDDAEFNGFVRGRNFLWRTRTGLHLLAGREDDRLRFEYQPELAKMLQFRDSDKRSAVERFLKIYFLNVRMIADLADIFALHFEEQINPPRRWRRSQDLGNGMSLRDGKVTIGDEKSFAAEPINLIKIFVEAQKEHRVMNSYALRIVRKYSRAVDAKLRVSKAANSMFLEILRSPRNVATSLNQMHETGVLGRFVPDFGRITGHGQFDRYHCYTVDAHTIRAIDVLRDFRLGEGQFIDMPLASKLMLELQRPELLFVALMFHDIAKGQGGDHSELGEHLSRKFCRRLGLSDDDTGLVTWLVRFHLDYSKTAQHYDLSDPEVIADFSRFIGDRERLVYLFLLTVADVTAVGPGTWTEWKGHLFSQLFYAVEGCLRAGRVTPDNQENRIASRRESVLKMCAKGEREEVASALAVLSNTSTLHFPPVVLKDLCCLLAQKSGAYLAVNESLGHTQVIVWGADRPKLFAHLTATLAGANTKALAAYAYSLRDGRILDEFHITDRFDSAVSEPGQLARLQQRLEDVLAGKIPTAIKTPASADVLMRALPVEVRHLEAAAKSITAIEVVAADRRGLLADIAEAIAEMNFDVRGANIATFGEKAVDVFFVTDSEGDKLDSVQTDVLIQRIEQAAKLEANQIRAD